MVNKRFAQALRDDMRDAQHSKGRETVYDAYKGASGIWGADTTILFNSNDYLGLRQHTSLLTAASDALQRYGTSTGSVRFISGTTAAVKQLEATLARFHGRESCAVFSSAFMVNLAVLSCFVGGVNKRSKIANNVTVVSDALNHRSIIDGLRLSQIAKSQRIVIGHKDMGALEQHLSMLQCERVVIVSDGVFSMLGDTQELKQLQDLKTRYEHRFSQGILIIVDDCHGVGAIGATGRGIEEVSGVQADVLVGTLGKAFGSEGGYVVGDRLLIEYLRECASSYIYSNALSPVAAAAGCAAVALVDSDEGVALLKKLRDRVAYFKKQAIGLEFVAAAEYMIQPILVGDTVKCQDVSAQLFSQGLALTPISYPVCERAKDELRVQLNALHTSEQIDLLVLALRKALLS